MKIAYFVCTENLNIEKNEVYTGCFYKLISDNYSEFENFYKTHKEKIWGYYTFDLNKFDIIKFKNDKFDLDLKHWVLKPPFEKIQKMYDKRNVMKIKEIFYYVTLKMIELEKDVYADDVYYEEYYYEDYFVPNTSQIALKFYNQKNSKKMKTAGILAKIQNNKFNIPATIVKIYKNELQITYCYYICFFFLNFLNNYVVSTDGFLIKQNEVENPKQFFNWLNITQKVYDPDDEDEDEELRKLLKML